VLIKSGLIPIWAICIMGFFMALNIIGSIVLALIEVSNY
jgi:hypothetical protein